MNLRRAIPRNQHFDLYSPTSEKVSVLGSSVEPGRIEGVMLQAALNGPFTKKEHPALPVSVQELARDAAACVAAGARAIHLHPRDSDERERLDAEVVEEVVMKVREACGVPVGVTTAAGSNPILDAVSSSCAPGELRTTLR